VSHGRPWRQRLRRHPSTLKPPQSMRRRRRLDMTSDRGRLASVHSIRGHRTRPTNEKWSLERLVDQLRLAMPIAEANTLQKPLRVIGPEAGDVTRLTRHSTQHEHLRGKRAGREQQRPCYSNPHEASTKFLEQSIRARALRHARSLGSQSVAADPSSQSAAGWTFASMTQREYRLGRRLNVDWLYPQALAISSTPRSRGTEET